MKKNKLKIAFIGIRGIPVAYSGFETTAEQVSTRLIDKGYSITVYCRKAYVDSNKKQYKGVSLVSISSPQSKNFETIIHSFLSTMHAILFCRYDAILYLGVGNSLISFLPRLFGVPTIVNIDGLDWQRKKWSLIGKAYLRLSEWSSQYSPTLTMTDTTFTQDYYEKTYHKKIPYITNGYISVNSSKVILEKYGLQKKGYIVWMGRLVPDNNLEELLLAYKEVSGSTRLVIIGGDYYDKNYQTQISKLIKIDKRIIQTGFIPQIEALQLMKDSLVYVETKRSGGAHPSLIEAIGMNCTIIANDHPTTHSIAGSSCLYYNYQKPVSELKLILQELFSGHKGELKQKKLLTWEQVTNLYGNLINELLTKNKSMKFDQ